MRVGLVAVLALGWLTVVWAETAILPLRHRLPQEVVQVIAPVLAEGERLVAVPEGIWVQASPERIEEIYSLVAALDKRSARLVVTVLQTDRLSLEELNAQAQAKIYETRSQRILGVEQRLLTLAGQPAFIAVGQELPVPKIHLCPQAIGGIEYLPATTGFQITPRLIGCRIRLEIAPWSRRPGGLAGELSVQVAKTTLEAELGRWVELGTSGLDEDLISTEIPAHRYQTQARRLHLFVKVEVPEGCEGENHGSIP